GDLLGGGSAPSRTRAKAWVGVPDQRKAPPTRKGKATPPVVRLDDIGAIVLEQTAHHDVAALVEPCGHGGRLTEHGAGEQLQPGPSGVDEDAGGGYVAPAPHVEHEAPCDAPLCLDAAGAGADYGAALGGVERAEHDETRVVR